MKWKLLVSVAAMMLAAPIVLQSNDTDTSDAWSYASLPGDHNIRLGNAFHAKGYETPYSAECTECHGQGLQGIGGSVPSCYGCHDNRWDEAIPVDIGPIIYFAEFQRDDKKNGKLKIVGENAAGELEVTIMNAITAEILGVTVADKDGAFASDWKHRTELPPCILFAEYTDDLGEVFDGPSIIVLDKQTGQPVQNCVGYPASAQS